MKFLEEHRFGIIKAIEDTGLTKNDFHFIKRRGRILTEYRHNRWTFSYFVKKEIHLDPKTKDFIESEQYEIKTSSGLNIMVNSWAEVLNNLKSWLKDLPR